MASISHYAERTFVCFRCTCGFPHPTLFDYNNVTHKAYHSPLPLERGWGWGQLGLRPVGFEFVSPTNKAATKQIVSSLPCNVVKRGRGRDLFAVMFVRNGEFLTTARTASSQNATTILRWHPLTETVLIHPSAVVGLKCSFHCFILIYCYNLAFEVQNYLFLFKQPNDNEDLSI